MGINLALGFELPVAFILTVFAGTIAIQIADRKDGLQCKTMITAAALGSFLGILLGTLIYESPLQLSIQTVPKAPTSFKYLFWGPLGVIKLILFDVLKLDNQVAEVPELIRAIPIPFQFYMASVGFYHLFEFLFVCSHHPTELCWESFLINQSKAYVGAQTFAIAEFFIEDYYIHHRFTFVRAQHVVISFIIGVHMVFVGHYFRIGAMFTAEKSFHHLVQTNKA